MVLGDLYPRRAAEFSRLAEEAGRMRLLAGVAFPSDVSAGAELGRQVAAAALERGRRDRSDQPWTGVVPTAPGLWNGTGPVLPQAGTWVPWLLASSDEVRPAHDSPERAAEMDGLRAIQRTPKMTSDALFWEVGADGGGAPVSETVQILGVITPLYEMDDTPIAQRCGTPLRNCRSQSRSEP